MFHSSSNGGAPSDLITSIKARLSQYSDKADNIVVVF